MPNSPPQEALPRIPATVWLLGFVSMFMDISSEMIHALLPVFVIDTLLRIRIDPQRTLLSQPEPPVSYTKEQEPFWIS